jgi:aspartyl-tRNA synthetase
LNGIVKEDCVGIKGLVEKRDEETYNPKIPSGTIEVEAYSIEILGKVYSQLPFEIQTSKEVREDVRLKYRYLDLRNQKVKDNMIFRSNVISFLRSKMTEMGFMEIQTPILCASSPEGARDYIVPSRKYKGKFYALPQAPQQYKQLLMVSGFDKYFQIAPCFRDEDARADRSPGEFYQLDFEMSFATQEDVFKVGEEVLTATFEKFAPEGYEVTKAPYPIISYKQAMLEFGTDKPDLRNPLRIIDTTEFFQRCTFKPFHKKTVRAIKVHANMSKGFHEKLLKFAQSIGMGGLGYLEVLEDLTFKGPIDKFIPDDMKQEMLDMAELAAGDTIFFIADKEEKANFYAGQIRTELGQKLDLIEKNAYRFCYINDFPMYEYNEEEKKIGFTHNPFSMPQGGLEALNTKDPLDILAYQYDIVCNGVELSSGAVRNHDMQIMIKAFEIAGYDEEILKNKFGALYNAFQFGAPPHAGMAPGVDRMIMLLRNEENIREVIPFPMSGTAQDLMCGAPNEVTEQQLREVHIKVRD